MTQRLSPEVDQVLDELTVNGSYLLGFVRSRLITLEKSGSPLPEGAQEACDMFEDARIAARDLRFPLARPKERDAGDS